jgi:hypothetical protein
MWAMVRKEFRELRRDRPTMAMLIVLPIKAPSGWQSVEPAGTNVEYARD